MIHTPRLHTQPSGRLPEYYDRMPSRTFARRKRSQSQNGQDRVCGHDARHCSHAAPDFCGTGFSRDFRFTGARVFCSEIRTAVVTTGALGCFGAMASYAFLTNAGAVVKHSAVESRAVLAQLDWPRLRAWEEAITDSGLTWERYSSRVPREVLLALLPVFDELLADVPRGALDIPPPRLEPDSELF
jgi:hypothetical protein